MNTVVGMLLDISRLLISMYVQEGMVRCESIHWWLKHQGKKLCW